MILLIDKFELWKKAANLRKNLGEDETSPIDIQSLAYSIDRLTMVFYPMGDHLSGMCIKNANNKIIAINSSMTLGRQHFSMAHELFHLYFDENLTAICAKKIGLGNEKENQADQFASYLLIPPNALTEMIQQVKIENANRLTVNDVVKLEQHFRVSRQAILYRLIEEKEITQQEAELLRQNIIKSAVRLGYDDALYKPLPINKQYMTYGFYIQQAEEVFRKGLISSGKYEELLLSAFRSDLVYGEEADGKELID